MMEQQRQAGNDDDLTRLLPEGVLAQVLCRLAPRDLAASRCVCVEWKGAIDGHRLLRTDLLPLSVGGIFLNFTKHWYAEFLRPSATLVSGSLTHLSPCADGGWSCNVKDHCNGLLLLHGCEANPATGWFAPLPPWPRPRHFFHQGAYLVFDPAVSPHYSVFILNYAPLYHHRHRRGDDLLEEDDDDPAAAMAAMDDEWPPSPYPFHQSDDSACNIDDLWVFGFPPYKEIVFMGSGITRAVAYDMNSSKFQYLGTIQPSYFDVYTYHEEQDIDGTFVYTPCKLEAYGHPGSAPLGG
ncbi:hypothetical protein BAE44_0007963 [Dichanthelium oligosanthes]|uniref:F-box domain-containing protein n=1 Tax=Dichanthelium oligosanthes TaxID=888268 RepID=A0A1E5W106_9POAL|nr:hypothetical protein BAE44_0007963 [Dichanthelium oligosanthes]